MLVRERCIILSNMYSMEEIMRKIKPLIYIFCEGESEVEYAKCLKEKYSDVAVKIGRAHV